MVVNNHSHSWLWWDGEKIDFNDLKNKPTVWTTIIGSTTHSGTWNKSIIIWFKPKLVTIFAFYTTTNNDYSRSWSYIDDNEIITVWTAYWDSQNFSLWSWDSWSIDAIYFIWWTNKAKIQYDEEWFTLINVNFSSSVTLHYTVYW